MNNVAVGKFLAVLGLVLCGVGALAYFGYVDLPLESGEMLYYPLYSSIGCELSGGRMALGSSEIVDGAKTVVCPVEGGNCYVKKPLVECSGGAWLGYTPVWTLKVSDSTPQNNVWCSPSNPVLDCKSFPSEAEVTVLSGGEVTFQGACVDNLYLVGAVVNPASLIAIMAGQGQVPSSGSLAIQTDKTHLVVHPALEGEYAISDVGCGWNLKLYAQYKNLVSGGDSDVMDKAEDMYKYLGVNIGDVSETEVGYRQSLSLGQYVRGVDKWTALPAFGNIKDYGSSKVICDLGKGLIKVDLVETNGGVDYYVPTTRLEEPDNFCCASYQCNVGAGYACVDFSCVKGGVSSCVSDLDCQPEGGVRFDSNCYQDSDGSFFLSSASCVSGVCVNTAKVSVDCCSSYCEAKGLSCDYEKGCVSNSVVKQECGEGFCCNVEPMSTNTVYSPYKSQSCGGGLSCTNVGINPYKGKCLSGEKAGDCVSICMFKLFGVVDFPDPWCVLSCEIDKAVKTVMGFVRMAVLGVVFMASYTVGLSELRKREKKRKGRKQDDRRLIMFALGIAAAVTVVVYLII